MAASSAPVSPGQQLDLLDFSKPLNVGVLDATVQMFYGAVSNVEVSTGGSSVGSNVLAAKLGSLKLSIYRVWLHVSVMQQNSAVLQTAYLLPALSDVCWEHRYASLQILALHQIGLQAAASC